MADFDYDAYASAPVSRRARPTTPATEWTLRDAERIVAWAQQGAGVTPLDDREYAANEAYVERHDHWQGGATWVGPDGGDPEIRRRVLRAVHRQYTPVDVVGEVLDRITNALLKRRPTIDFLPLALPPETEPSEAQQADAAALREAVSGWMRRVQFAKHVRRAVRRSRWATRGLLRVWIPAAHLVDVPEAGTGDADGGDVPPQQPAPRTGLPTGLLLADALARISLSSPAPHEAAVVLDEATQTRVGVVLVPDADGKPMAEVWRVDAETGATVCRVLRRTGAAAVTLEDETPLALGGRLPLAEMEGELLLTEPVRAQQARLNFVESTMNRAVETAGFRERYVINAAPHGFWSERQLGTTPAIETRVVEGRVQYLYPSPRTLGSAVTTEIAGVPYDVDEQGRRAFTTPSVVFADPVDPAYIVRASEHARATILRSCKQGHVLGADATQSGQSREEARAEFEDDVVGMVEPTQTLLTETIGAALALANLMLAAGDPLRDALDRYRIVVTLHVDTGPPSSDDIRADGEQVAAGRLSRRTAMQRLGVEDVDAELQRIMEDPLQRAAVSRAQAEAVAAWGTAGVGIGGAGRAIGLTDDEIRDLETNGGVTPGLDGITP